MNIKSSDLTEVKMITKQNMKKFWYYVLTFKEHRQIFMIFSTRGYYVREVLTRKVMITSITFLINTTNSDLLLYIYISLDFEIES